MKGSRKGSRRGKRSKVPTPSPSEGPDPSEEPYPSGEPDYNDFNFNFDLFEGVEGMDLHDAAPPSDEVNMERGQTPGLIPCETRETGPSPSLSYFGLTQ